MRLITCKDCHGVREGGTFCKFCQRRKVDENPTYWFRFDEQSYSVSNEWGEHSHSRLELQLRKVKVIRETPKGVWVIGGHYGWNNPRFILKDARKRHACSTVEEAKASFIARKEKQARIYRARAEAADNAAQLAYQDKYVTFKDW